MNEIKSPEQVLSPFFVKEPSPVKQPKVSEAHKPKAKAVRPNAMAESFNRRNEWSSSQMAAEKPRSAGEPVTNLYAASLPNADQNAYAASMPTAKPVATIVRKRGMSRGAKIAIGVIACAVLWFGANVAYKQLVIMPAMKAELIQSLKAQ